VQRMPQVSAAEQVAHHARPTARASGPATFSSASSRSSRPTEALQTDWVRTASRAGVEDLAGMLPQARA
jgi:hypothetical protein